MTILHRSIYSKRDLERFLQSDTYNSLMDFISKLNKSIMEKSNNQIPFDENLQWLVEFFVELKKLTNHLPPSHAKGIKNIGRFGDPIFREWHKEAINLTSLYPNITEESKEYLSGSFGNPQRLDYGTGHELSFIAFLYCLFKCGKIEISSSLIFHIFYNGYINLMRLIQSTYWLEPAGSHGVWGLDDYHFLPFLFGSSQLINHSHLLPKSIHNLDIIDEFKSLYLYLDCIAYINKVKRNTGLAWHSPMLNDISIVPDWERVNLGLIKMYRGEVLSKLPIMQHFLFGNSLPFEEGDPRDEEHQHGARGDCCGNPIPSIHGVPPPLD